IDVAIERPRVREPADVDRLELRQDVAAHPEVAGARTAAEPLDTAAGRERGAPGAEGDRHHAGGLRDVHDGADVALPADAEQAAYVDSRTVVGRDVRDVRERHVVG